MQTQTVPYVDQNAISALSEGFPYILLDMHYRNRNAHMAYFLAAEQQAFYYAAIAADNDPAVYIAHLTEAIQSMAGDTDRRGKSKAAQNESPTEQMQKLVKEIGKAHPRFIVLDQVDELGSADFYEIVTTLRAALSNKTQLVINTRQLDYKMWRSLVESKQAVVIGDLDLPEDRPSPKAFETQVEVYGFGGGQTFSDGQAVTVWDGPLPRNLFYYFTDHPMITREEVFSTFWPDLPTKEATNVFHVTKRKVTERIGHETMVYAGGFYQEATDVNIYYDVKHFEMAIEQGRRNPEDIAAWEYAIKLYRQPFLHRLTMPWIVQRRQQLTQDHTEALIALARHHRPNNPDLAVNFYLRAARETPHREDVQRDLITIFAEQGQMDRARNQYRVLETELKRAFNLTPGKATRELYASLAVNGTKRH